MRSTFPIRKRLLQLTIVKCTGIDFTKAGKYKDDRQLHVRLMCNCV